jgi:putative transposase
MTNHVHMLVTPEIPDGVSLLFRDLGRDFVRTFNKIHGRTGTLWDCRFKSSIVDSDEYLLACYRYIELNPVRAGIVSHPAEYQWSSFRTNAMGEESPLITAHETWRLLGHTDKERRRAYQRLFESGLDSNQLANIRQSINKGLPTGNPDFRKKIESTVGFPLRTRRPNRQEHVPDQVMVSGPNQ